MALLEGCPLKKEGCQSCFYITKYNYMYGFGIVNTRTQPSGPNSWIAAGVCRLWIAHRYWMFVKCFAAYSINSKRLETLSLSRLL